MTARAEPGYATLAEVRIRRQPARMLAPAPAPPTRPDASVPPAPPPGTPAATTPPANHAKSPETLARHWSEKRLGRPLPSLSDFNLDEIACDWPGTALMTWRGGHLQLLRRLAPGDGTGPKRVAYAYSPAVLDWFLHTCREAALAGHPVIRGRHFPEPGRPASHTAPYTAMALPVTEDPAPQAGGPQGAVGFLLSLLSGPAGAPPPVPHPDSPADES